MAQLLIIDLFCGAGGTTTGFAKVAKNRAKVIACVNHDPVAIKSHWQNHPEVYHFEEDIRTLDLTELIRITLKARNEFPDAKLILWASLECTNFSKAKGGLPREADSRTLANHLDRYVKALDPDYIQIENVVEFMSWGPLDDNGKPLSLRAGSDWLKWRQHINAFGYYDDWKEMNAADFGAYTSRNRLFGIFAKQGLSIAWPEPTHAKNPDKAARLFGKPLKKWKAVRDVLDLETKGESIFNRKKPLSPKTMHRIYAGLIKFVAGGKENFLVKYNSSKSNGEPWAGNSSDEPCPTVATQNRLAVCQTEFISKYYSGKPEHKNISIDGPAGTIKTVDGQAIVQTQFLTHYYSNGFNTHVDQPCPTVTTKDRAAIVDPQFIMRNFTTSSNRSIEVPAGTLLPVPKQHLVSAEPFLVDQSFGNGSMSIDRVGPTILACRKNHYLVNPSWSGNTGDIDTPCCTIIPRQDKSPLYLVEAVCGQFNIPVYNTDCEYTVKIKHFMALYGMVDIKMRMLMIPELIRIQGFPKSYKLSGTQSDQKKFIGNSVVPQVVKAWAESLIQNLFFTHTAQKVA